jgi:hypothetical protein
MKAHFVDVGDGAQVTFPTVDLCYQARYGENRDVCAASALESFRHIVLECTKAEAWRRILCIREAVKSANATAKEQK